MLDYAAEGEFGFGGWLPNGVTPGNGASDWPDEFDCGFLSKVNCAQEIGQIRID
jgi:hypothetical protein